MKKAISKWLLCTLGGWKIGSLGENIPKSIICVAPHTSNWDFIIGKLFYNSIGRSAGFLIKKDWFFFPFNLIFNSLGGVPVDRKKSTSVTDQMVEVFNQRKEFHLAVTPEATRKRAEEWKKGFYFIALKANVPIQIAYLDYGKKEVGFKGLFYPTGDVEADLYKIRTYYRGVVAKYPERFVEV